MPRKPQFGSTWWGEQWIGALEALGSTWANRLPRGRTYARKGAVAALLVSAGRVNARVRGSRPQPYRVMLQLPALTDAQWEQVVAALVAEARFCAQLLAGEMPRDVDAAFRTAGVGLFPRRASELGTDCSCPDWANPCKHVAAVHYVLGQEFDRDPFLLFEIRGRSRDALLDALRRARAGGGDEGGDAAEEPEVAVAMETVVLEATSPDAFLAARATLDDLHFRPAPPDAELAVLRRIGTPGSWTEPASPADVLGPVYAAASRRALERALGGVGDAEGSEEAGRPVRPGGVKRPAKGGAMTGGARALAEARQPPAGRVLAALARGPLGFRELEAALRRGPKGMALRQLLATLRAEGRVEVEGRTRGARYRLV
jgi:uncharacterized Zn finger protein